MSHELKSEKMSQIVRLPIGRCGVRLWTFVYPVNKCISAHQEIDEFLCISVSDIGINAVI